MSFQSVAMEWGKIIAVFIGAFAAFRVGAIKALRDDLQTYKDRCDTLEKELIYLKSLREKDQIDIAMMKTQRDLEPVAQEMRKMADSMAALATCFDQVLRPTIEEHLQHSHSAPQRRRRPAAKPAAKGDQTNG